MASAGVKIGSCSIVEKMVEDTSWSLVAAVDIELQYDKGSIQLAI